MVKNCKFPFAGTAEEELHKSEFVDIFLLEHSVETVVLLCRKAEQADRHIAVDYEPQGRHMEKRL